jgi:hypothetical protein
MFLYNINDTMAAAMVAGWLVLLRRLYLYPGTT